MTVERAKELAGRYPWFKAPRVIISDATGESDRSLDLQFTFFSWPVLSANSASIAEPQALRTSFVIENFLSLDDVHTLSAEAIPSGDMSLSQEDMDSDMVTEELAEIYLAQGHKTVAEEIYRKLSLLYPEKSVYFAELIGKISSDNQVK